MTRMKVRIAVSGDRDETFVYLPRTLIKKLKLPEGLPIRLKAGAYEQYVRVMSAPRLTDMRLSEGLLDRTGLEAGSQLCIRYKDRTLALGPLIGVLLRGVPSKNPERPFGNITSFCQELIQAGEQYGAQVFFFTPSGAADTASLRGWTFSGRWKQRRFPLPDVVYNRLTSRIIEDSNAIQTFMREAKSRGVHIFNERYLNKAEVFEALGKEKDLSPYLPESYLYRNSAMMKAMFNRHPVLFLKPIMSSLGKGIIRIRKHAGGAFTCHFASPSGPPREAAYPSFAKLISGLSGKLKSNKYLLQEGLDLITVKGSPVDFRALVQRNGEGQWSITSIVARIAGSQNFVSNLARGGRLSPVPEALAQSNLNGMLQKKVRAELSKGALEIAKGIETQIDAHFAELGIDLAADTRGRVLLLEINSKPSKEDNTPLAPSDEPKIRPSVRRVVQYARFLGQF